MLEGEISQINLIERLVELWREQFTGAIRFENDGIIKIIYFKGGDILSASTNDRADSIDEILMRAGKVSREHVKQALARRKESETLGDAMLNLGYITRKELTWARRVQVVGVIRSITAWTTGSFTIVADYLPKRDEGTLFPLPQVLVELIVTEQDRSAIERALDGGAVVYQKAADFEEVFRRLGLNEDAEAIVAQVDGRKNASEVASASGRDAFNVYKLLHAFSTLGILSALGKPQVKHEFSLDDDAVGDAAELWTPEPGSPSFELDEAEAVRQPTLEVPGLSMEEEHTSIVPIPARSAWDMDTEEIAPSAPVSSNQPAWDAPPAATVAVPMPAAVPSVAEPAQEQWGFDEAQLETAQRAAQPSKRSAPTFAGAKPRPAKVKAGGGRTVLLLALLAILVLAGAGYFGFLWWQKQQEAPAAVATKTPTAKSVPATPSQPATDTTMTIVDATDATKPPIAATATTTTTTLPSGTTTAPTTSAPPVAATPSAPLTVTGTAAAPPVATTTTKPAPAAVSPRQEGRIADMAREFAANPRGNFTVQIQILCNPANVEKAMKDGGANVWFVPQTLGTRSCYRVFWGNFATREEAQRALASVPAILRDPTAAVKPVPRSQP